MVEIILDPQYVVWKPKKLIFKLQQAQESLAAAMSLSDIRGIELIATKTALQTSTSVFKCML